MSVELIPSVVWSPSSMPLSVMTEEVVGALLLAVSNTEDGCSTELKVDITLSVVAKISLVVGSSKPEDTAIPGSLVELSATSVVSADGDKGMEIVDSGSGEISTSLDAGASIELPEVIAGNIESKELVARKLVGLAVSVKVLEILVSASSGLPVASRSTVASLVALGIVTDAVAGNSSDEDKRASVDSISELVSELACEIACSSIFEVI